ncbi:50S ribosomal protein L25 [Vitis vinifera]|uniref:50S ribosomal protein L25 n=1 Tax=Vitis vinifera TaxID=29760 RepID=A0A438GD70_VITVI|nr:50S ribosomal protein L25 [Vitis vinifera]
MAARNALLKYLRVGTFLDKSEVTDRVISVVKNFQKVDPSKHRNGALSNCVLEAPFALPHSPNQSFCQMLIHRHRQILTNALHLRHFSQSAAAAAVLQDPLEPPPLTYLEGFPRPDPKFAEIIHAIPRTISGKNISAKERKVGRVPSIVFEQEDGQHGGNKRLISVRTNQIRKLVNHLGRSFFLSRLFDLEVGPDFESNEVIEKVRVLPRKLHLHAGTDAVLNVTFIRAPSHALLKVDVPLVFRGEDVSPGLKKGNAF